MGLIELRVTDGGEDVLIYTFRRMADTAEMMGFLAEFMPDAKFLIQPLRH